MMFIVCFALSASFVWLITSTYLFTTKASILYPLSQVVVFLLFGCWIVRSGKSWHRWCHSLGSRPEDTLINDLGTLIEAWHCFFMYTKDGKETVKPLLTRLLNQLSTSSAPSLLPEQIRSLNRMLSDSDPEFVLATLSALERDGNADSLRAIQLLMSGKGQVAFMPQVQEAAFKCFDILDERLRLQRQPETLLRPSKHAASPDVLLRPASGAEHSNAEATELLRSTSAQETTSSQADAFSAHHIRPTTPPESVQQIQNGQQANQVTP